MLLSASEECIGDLHRSGCTMRVGSCGQTRQKNPRVGYEVSGFYWIHTEGVQALFGSLPKLKIYDYNPTVMKTYLLIHVRLHFIYSKCPQLTKNSNTGSVSKDFHHAGILLLLLYLIFVGSNRALQGAKVLI